MARRSGPAPRDLSADNELRELLEERERLKARIAGRQGPADGDRRRAGGFTRSWWRAAGGVGVALAPPAWRRDRRAPGGLACSPTRLPV
jgi:hypothetical protein